MREELLKLLEESMGFMVEWRKDGLYLLLHHWKYLDPVKDAKRVILLKGKQSRLKRMEELGKNVCYVGSPKAI